MNYEDHVVQDEWQGQKIIWPKMDKKLRAVNDWVNDLNSVLLLMERAGRTRRVAVQAGGACGIWPLELAKHFELVYTFEPEPVNFWCLAHNCSAHPSQIVPMLAALGELPGLASMKLPPSEKGNAGAFYTVPDQKLANVLVVKLDDQPLFNVDLLCLDIEGREVEALRGAYNVLETWKPWVMIEEKQLPQMGKGKDVPHQPGAATEWLQKIHGYHIAGKVHRDVILAPPE